MAAGATYEPIATATGSTSITFSSIPSTYTDLRLVINGTADYALRFNGDSATNYSRTILEGSGTAASSIRFSNVTAAQFHYNYVSAPSFLVVDILNYAGSTNKTAIGAYSNDNNGTGYVSRGVALWRNTAAINSILIFVYTSTATATLYGIKAA